MTQENRPSYSGDRETTPSTTPAQNRANADKKPERETPQRQPPSGDNQTKPSTSSKSKSKKKLPQLGNLSALKADLEKEANQKEKDLDAEVLQKKVIEVWKNFRENHPSPSLSVFMKDAKLIFNDMNLKVVVTSQLARSSIVEQRDLFEEIRSTASPHILEIEFEIDSTSAASTVHEVSLITTQDKYNALLAKNSTLAKLVQKLNLKVDND
ncbi:hypothetical protein [Membranihabitans marinus]|uniref:hypothetical protein n=1 Tax=Membranihabitans marinus TaxID=1227546 RepID=UPI001F2CE321|nr:hypothetical protein [Membranihabitans marinus]